ncbi:hypothetical protein [Chryseobacterium echinoideorum]|uniref:hypothetical protein n=1 Tax=Chryseobacterium echinoideorum TaxID=1549648 RepID=UPI001184E7F2|nr:hypothetical protein [Chryseobacterium echinoideorum]
MLSIFIVVAAYRYYARLAEKFGKTKWHFGLLAIVIYFGFQILFLFSYTSYLAISNPDSLDDNNYAGFSLMNMISWIFAIAAVFGFYKVLENKFEKEIIKPNIAEIEEIGSDQAQNFH